MSKVKIKFKVENGVKWYPEAELQQKQIELLDEVTKIIHRNSSLGATYWEVYELKQRINQDGE